jgi:hypothetical protein
MVSSSPLLCSKWSSNILIQPAKRRAAEAATPKARQSKLAKEHNITNEEENEIKEAFALFTEEKKGEKEGVIPIGDVRRAMMYSLLPLLFPSTFAFRSPAISQHKFTNDELHEVHWTFLHPQKNSKNSSPS